MCCVRCGGQHAAAACPRPLTEKPTCANCGREHTANSRVCPVLRREARKRGIIIPPPAPNHPATAPEREPSPVPRPGSRPAAPSRRPPTTAPIAAPRRRPPMPPNIRPSCEAPSAPVVAANPATTRGEPVPRRRKRPRGGKKKKRKPVASSTPLQPEAAQAPASRWEAPPSTAQRPAPALAYTMPGPAPLPRPCPLPQQPPLPQRERVATRGRQRPAATHITTETVQGAGAPTAPAAGTTTTRPAGNPTEVLLGVLTEFLIAIAAGVDLQSAAVRGLALLQGIQYG